MTTTRNLRTQGAKASTPAEAAILGRVAGEGAPVGAVVEVLASDGFSLDESVLALQALQRDKRVSVQEAKPYETLASYAWSPLSVWFWGALAAVTASLALISVTSGVAIYLRYVFGSILVLFLPGYALIEALYPKGELEELTRFALSIGLSLALVPLTGLALNYTPWGIRLLPVALSLAGLTVALLLLALKRKHSYYRLARGIP
ncbi:MAG TPA: DUF1616 domain-containing protein [Nitrososphaerales archaeon]|nr:DUF1616 domain-containing protein [Nitrososphaerales archaeon]